MDVRAELSRIAEKFESDRAIQDSLNILLYGDLGTRKTSLVTTGRRPVYIASFDPGGTKIQEVREGIKEGWCFVERFEGDMSTDPTKFDEWYSVYQKQVKSDFFTGIGTYCIDSTSTWVNSLMNKRTSKLMREGGIPAIQDYLYVGTVLKDIIGQIGSLPCDFILTGHIARDQDEVTGAIHTSLNTFKSLREYIPQLFDEVYVTMPKPLGPNETEVKLLTQNDGRYKAKTRIGGHGIFDKLENMDIKALLRKAGLDDSDKL